MIKVEASTPSSDPARKPSLADLSRNTSVISSSSSSSSTSDLASTPRPRPIRTFSSPRSRSPGGPTTPRASRPPAYITKELGLAEEPPQQDDRFKQSARAQSKSKSRSSSVNGRLSAEDFEFGEVLGEGAYSTVMHVTHRATRQEYAIKVLDKGHLKRNNKLQTALAEKNTLVRLGSGHPGIVRLHWAFQDEWSLYFVLDLAKNGELQSRIARMGSLSTTCARYYTAQLVDALDYMHNRGVIHRDLKPENLLLDDEFRIKVTDFGTGKLIDIAAENATKTFVGTAQYVSPELLEANETSKSSDLWAIGCVIYQMIAGRFAFQGLSEYLTWQKIKQLEYTFPEGFDEQAKDLIRRLLVRDPLERLGAGPPGSTNDMASLRAHPFLHPINWSTLWTDPAPPLETGLVRREPHPGEQNWDDVGAAWDDLVSGDPDGGDGMEWADDAEGAEYRLFGGAAAKAAYDAGFVPPEEVGPMGELPEYARDRGEAVPQGQEVEVEVGAVGMLDSGSERTTLGNGTGHGMAVGMADGVPAHLAVGEAPQRLVNGSGGIQFALPQVNGNGHDRDQGGVDLDRTPTSESPLGSRHGELLANGDADGHKRSPEGKGGGDAPGSPPISVPATLRDSYSTSSSDGSPVEKLGAALEAMGLNRGRNRGRSPVRASSSTPEPDWASVLGPGEDLLFHSPVEETVLKRRTSRLLLPLPVTPRRPKDRQLALTSHRLVCLKLLKGARGVGVKSEYGLRASEKEKEKDREKEARSMITGVASKGGREFVVLTTSKSAFFAAENEEAAAAWIEKISTALQLHQQLNRERKLSNANAHSHPNTSARS
ncbi:kinase-like protein [Auriscalpium vulgare]|uniref:Kinase-like protein n=1 Tax=Auriscalpium vulgare TaxID=40419 RepID=A0ACB8RKM4_9AGAM|nr:kinase-like protein [Auriscalpium vulgare]